MILHACIQNLKRIMRVVSRFGGRRWIANACLAAIAAVAQLAAIASLAPFLSLITETNRFRESAIGQRVANVFPNAADAELVALFGATFFLLVAISNGITLMSAYLDVRLIWSIGHKLRSFFYRRYLSQDLDYYITHEAGVSLKNIASDTTIMAAHVLTPLMALVSHVTLVVCLTIAMAFISWQATAIVFVVVVALYGVVAMFFRSPVKRHSESLNDGFERLYAIAEESINNITYLKFHGAEQSYANAFGGVSQKLAGVKPRLTASTQIPKTLFETLAVLGIVVWAIVAQQRGGISTGDVPLMGLMLFASYRLLPACQRIYACVTQIAAYIYTLHELEVFLDSSDEAEAGHAPDIIPLPFQNEIVCEGVSFAHPSGDGANLRDVTFSINKFDRVSIMGETGSGKTTLVTILLQLRQADCGRIVVDGRELHPEDAVSWRASVGYVPQTVCLRHGTIAENVSFDDEYDLAKVKRCCELAEIAQFIEKDLVDGYNTFVGDGDTRLSGGQRQRLGIARALYRSPPVLVLDEATSALDELTERRLLESISAPEVGLTLVIVSHRNLAQQYCNKRFAIKNGRLSKCA